MSNPYHSSTAGSIQANHQPDFVEMERPCSMWFTIPVGLILGGLLTAIVALGLAFVVLLPPISGFFGLDGEFDGLWLIGIPIFSLPCGAIGGLMIGGIRKWPHSFYIAMVFVSLPAAAHFFLNAWGKEMTKNPRDVFASTVIISVCMVLSSAISLMLVGTLFRAIERYRSSRVNSPYECDRTQ